MPHSAHYARTVTRIGLGFGWIIYVTVVSVLPMRLIFWTDMSFTCVVYNKVQLMVFQNSDTLMPFSLGLC